MTGITNIRIITIKEITLDNDSILPVGGAFKIAVEFPITFQGFRYDIELYENQERFEAGDAPLKAKNLITNGEFLLENRIPQVNIYAVYGIVTDFINNQFEEPICEVQLTYGEI